MPDLHAYEVGKLYNPNVRRWPETSQFNFRGGGYEFVLFYANPSAVEIAEVKSAPVEFALVPHGPCLFLLFRFGINPWSDAVYNWWLVSEKERSVPDPMPTETAKILLPLVLVDASTGIIKAQRAVTLSPEFSRVLQQAIAAQADTPFPGQSEYSHYLNHVYTQYPTSQDMLTRAVARCVGGT